MRRLVIPKRGGGERVVWSPSVKEKVILRNEMRRITSHTPKTLPHAHGFMEGRSPLTAALEHRGFPVTINLDLKDFFPSVKPSMVTGLVPKDINQLVWAGDGCGQGLPTAPMIANLAARSLDEAVMRTFTKKKKANVINNFAYTRYADDLSLSLDPDPGQEVIEAFKKTLNEIVTRCGFRANAKKWRVLRAAGGRREIVGLLVGDRDDRIRPRREWRRRHRAILHKIRMLEDDVEITADWVNARYWREAHAAHLAAEADLAKLKAVAQGWLQWAEPKMPLPPDERERKAAMRRIAVALEDANKLAKKAGMATLPVVQHSQQEREEKIPNTRFVMRITNDPVYFIGVSDYVTISQKTSSCLRLGLAYPGSRRGQYAGGGGWWWHLRGVSIAQVVDTSCNVVAAGVSRPAQVARVLVFETREGHFFYQNRFYHSSDNLRHKLEMWLQDHGYRSVRDGEGYQDSSKCETVVGNVPQTCNYQIPYMDHGHRDSATLANSKTKVWKVRV